MTVNEFAASVTANLPYTPNKQQEQLIGALARFCSSSTPSDSVFIINGYAGTGKTSLTGALVRSLMAVGREVVLLAPTGRAAKVMSAGASHPASTIHRRIYRGPTGDLTGGNTIMQRNTLSNAVFIVDEASMIGDTSAEGTTSCSTTSWNTSSRVTTAASYSWAMWPSFLRSDPPTLPPCSRPHSRGSDSM